MLLRTRAAFATRSPGMEIKASSISITAEPDFAVA